MTEAAPWRQYRVATRQAHPVPTKVTRPSNPFAPELFAGKTVVTDYEPEEDHSAPGATAQNNFRPEQIYQCRRCAERVTESDVTSHVCPEGKRENDHIEDSDSGQDHARAEPEA